VSRAPKHVSFSIDNPSSSSVAPSSSSSRKRKASPIRLQNALSSKHIRIQEKSIEIDDDDNRSEEPYCGSDDGKRDTTEEDSDCMEVKPPPQTDRSRALSTIPDKLQGLVRRAQADITHYTLFRMPFLSPVEILFLLSDSWERAQDAERRFELKTKAVDTYVSTKYQ
jgi:hypothetical protein